MPKGVHDSASLEEPRDVSHGDESGGAGTTAEEGRVLGVRRRVLRGDYFISALKTGKTNQS